MNKLVSKNPIQRFKEGRKIEKFETGGFTYNGKHYVGGGTKIVNWLKKQMMPFGAIPVKQQSQKTKRTVYPLYNSTTGETTYYNSLEEREAAKQNIINSKNNITINNSGVIPGVNDIDTQMRINQLPSAKLKKPLKTQEQWNTEFQNNFINNLTQDQRQYLDSQGVNFNDVKAVQKFIGTNDDGKWGRNSINAWNKFISTIPQNFSQTREEQSMMQGTTPYVETPITPTKYTTNNTYMDKTQFRDNIRGLGIQSNADLINWMHQTGAEGYDFGGNQWAKQFRNDVDRVLGGDYSDANIRKTFNTAGNWGRGFLGGGDLSDFQNAMATNAGVWNGIADAGKQPTIQFDRSATREWLRNNAGGSAYAFTGDQRKAVRNILNGQGTDQDKELIKGNADLVKALTGYFKTGGNMILPSRNIVERFKQGKKIEYFQNGGVKRFKVSYKTRTGGDWLEKQFNTQEEVNAFRKRLSHVPVFKVDDMKGASRGSVVKADRTKGKDAATTAYDRQEAEKNNMMSFKQAYSQARKSGNKYFAYKGKVYKSDLENGKDNMTEMQQLYGTHLGYSSNPKLQNKQSRTAREQYRKDTKATNTNRNANFKGETNSQANARADKNFDRKLGVSTLAPDFIDAVSPQTAIGNFMNMAGSAITGEHFTPKIYQNGFNIPGYASDLTQSKYKDLAFRGLDAYLSLGAPGARVNMTPGGTNVTEGATILPNGTREFSKWHLRSLGPNATRPMEGVLRSSRGTTYYIDNGQFMKNLTIPALVSNPIIQQIQNLEK